MAQFRLAGDVKSPPCQGNWRASSAFGTSAQEQGDFFHARPPIARHLLPGCLYL